MRSFVRRVKDDPAENLAANDDRNESRGLRYPDWRGSGGLDNPERSSRGLANSDRRGTETLETLTRGGPEALIILKGGPEGL